MRNVQSRTMMTLLLPYSGRFEYSFVESSWGGPKHSDAFSRIKSSAGGCDGGVRPFNPELTPCALNLAAKLEYEKITVKGPIAGKL